MHDNPGFHPDIGHFTQAKANRISIFSRLLLIKKQLFFFNFLTLTNFLHGTVEILLQIAVLSAVQKLARFFGSREN